MTTVVEEKNLLDTLELGSEILAEIARHTSNAVIVTDLDGQIIYVNEGFERITGYNQYEVIGKKPGKLLQGEKTDAATIKRIRKNLKQHQRVNETILNYTKSGRPYWLQLDIFPLEDQNGALKYFMAIESDVTELKEKERIAREQNQRIQENISYAELLQSALFRGENKLQDQFPDCFILDHSKDTVGGDFYHIDNILGQKIVLLGDCTGHGVSGAIMTAMSLSVLKENLETYKTLDPAMILTKSLEKLSTMLSNSEHNLRDSFECSLVFIDEKKRSIRYASTNQSLYLVSDQIEKVIKRSKRTNISTNGPVTIEGNFEYESGTMLYLSSDGLQDQFGGEEDKRFTSARALNLFSSVHRLPGTEQAKIISQTLDQWIGDEEQTDDILTIGIRLS